MVEVRTFDSWDEAQEEMDRAMRAADSRVKPWQTRIKPGDYVLSMAEGEPVFSEVLEAYADPRLQHYRFVRSYSVWVPDGEAGDQHVVTVLRVLSHSEFLEARANGWALPLKDGGGS